MMVNMEHIRSIRTEMTVVDENGTERLVSATLKLDPAVQRTEQERLQRFEETVVRASRNMWEAGALR